MTEWQELARTLADQLTAAGQLHDPALAAALTAVPRHALVPHFYQQTPNRSWNRVDATDPSYYTTVYSNTTLRLRHTYRVIRTHPGRASGEVVDRLNAESGEQGTSLVDHPASEPERASGQFRAHVITAMYSSVDERALDLMHEPAVVRMIIRAGHGVGRTPLR